MSLRHAALGLLAADPGSGYDLLQRFDSSMRHVWSATQSQLYTELNRLRKDGFIEVRVLGARNRKEYQITAAGLVELSRWVLDEHREGIRDAEMLKVFVLGEVDPLKAQAYLRRRVAQVQSDLTVLEQVRDSTAWDDSASDRFARMALEGGLRLRAAELDWSLWALHELPESAEEREASSPAEL